MTNLINAINKSKTNVLIDYDIESDHIVVVFAPAGEDDNEEKILSEVVEFEDQERESISGYEYPEFSNTTITPNDDMFDKDIAVSDALIKAKHLFNII